MKNRKQQLGKRKLEKGDQVQTTRLITLNLKALRKFFKNRCGYYLPHNVPMKFCKKVLAGKKKLLKME